MKSSNATIVAVVGGIVAISAMVSALTIALFATGSPTDATPVATSVLMGFATTVAALVAILKSLVNGQQQSKTQTELRENTVMTAAVAAKVGVPCTLSRNCTDGKQPVEPGGTAEPARTHDDPPADGF